MSGRLSFENLKNNKPIGSQRAGLMPSLQHLSGDGRYEQYKMGGMNYSTANRVKQLIKERKPPVKELDNNQFLSDYRGKAAAARADDIMNQVVATEVLRAREAFNKGLRGPRLSGMVGNGLMEFGRTLQGSNQMFPTDGNWRIATINNPAFRNQVAAQWVEPDVEVPVRVPNLINRDLDEERRQRNRQNQAIGNEVLGAYLRRNYGDFQLPEGEGIRLPRRPPQQEATAPPDEAEIDMEEWIDVPREARGEGAVAAIQRRFRERQAEQRAQQRRRRAARALDDAFDLGPMEGQTAAAGPATNVVRRSGNAAVEMARDAAEASTADLSMSAAAAQADQILGDPTQIGSTYYELARNANDMETRAQAAAIPRTRVIAEPSMLTPLAGGGMDANPLGTNSITPQRTLRPTENTMERLVTVARESLASTERSLNRVRDSGTATPADIAKWEARVQSDRNMVSRIEQQQQRTVSERKMETVTTMLTTPQGMARRLEGMQGGSIVEPSPFGVKRELVYTPAPGTRTPRDEIDPDELAAMQTVTKLRTPEEEEAAEAALSVKKAKSDKEIARLRRLERVQRELAGDLRNAGYTPPTGRRRK